MRAVITGANSFIGKCLSEQLLRQGWEIVQVSRCHVQENGGSNCRHVCLSMEEYQKLGAVVGPCDCFIQLAWNGTRGVDRMDIQKQRNNVRYSMDGLQSMLKVGCQRVITAGSQAEYGPCGTMITEESECHPNTEYGKAKLEFFRQASALCQLYSVPMKEPRFFSLYGPNDFAGTMIISILEDMRKGRPCRLTKGIQMWDFLYIEDAVRALSMLCSAQCADGVYNFGSGDIRHLRDYVIEMAEITRTKSELLFGAVPYPPTGMISLWPDISKLRNELNWSPTIRFADGIRLVIDTMEHGNEQGVLV